MATPKLRPIAAPTIPLVPREYAGPVFDAIHRALRVYFNQIDNAVRGLVGTRGGQYLDNPYGAFSSATTQSTAVADTPYVVALSSADYSNGVTLSSNKMTVEQSGIYNLQFSLQIENTASQAHSIWVWIRKNGVDIDGTGSTWDVPSTHGSSNGYVVPAANFYISLTANDYVELVYAASSITVSIEAYASSTSPFTRPAIPASVVTVSFVSALP